MMAHRSEFFDRSLAAATAADAEPPVGQVVILGAGWDTRAYGSPAASRLRFFEVDMAPTLAAKRAALERAGLPTGYVAFVETDFNQTSWYRALVEQGFDPALPAFILWEGVTMYVGEDAVDATLRQVAELAPGSRIAFDYWSRELMCSEAPFERDGQEVQAGMKFYGEAFIYGIPTKAPARDPVERLLISHGLELADFEPMGPDGKIHGGLALAICRGFSPARPSPPR
jgi:methyltransferase (TIGR00027 family)